MKTDLSIPVFHRGNRVHVARCISVYSSVPCPAACREPSIFLLLAALWLTLAWVGTRPSLAANQVVAWGLNRYGVCDVPPNLTDVVSLSSGYDHALALRADGSVVAWGSNLEGERDVPADLGVVVAVVAGDWVSFALRADGTIRGWGGSLSSGFLPVPDTVGRVVDLSMGSGSHLLALRLDGTVAAWGGNNFAQQLAVPANLTNVVQIAAGYGYSLALTSDGQVVSWGGRLPFPRPETTNVVAIAAGWLDAYLLQTDGQVVHWGPSTAASAPPLFAVAEATAITAGRASLVALRRDGTVVQWPPAPSSAESVPMPSNLVGVTVVTARGDHSLALVGKPAIDGTDLRILRSDAGCAVQFQSSVGRTYRLQFKGLADQPAWQTRAIRCGDGGIVRCETDSGLDAALFRLVIH